MWETIILSHLEDVLIHLDFFFFSKYFLTYEGYKKIPQIIVFFWNWTK